jgi:hypothetical protein
LPQFSAAAILFHQVGLAIAQRSLALQEVKRIAQHRAIKKEVLYGDFRRGRRATTLQLSSGPMFYAAQQGLRRRQKDANPPLGEDCRRRRESDGDKRTQVVQ